jgi:hypothetical protein
MLISLICKTRDKESIYSKRNKIIVVNITGTRKNRELKA